MGINSNWKHVIGLDLLIDTIKILKKRPKDIGKIILIDVGYLLVLWLISALFKMVIPADTQILETLTQNQWLELFVIVFTLVYFCVLFLSYTANKYFVIHTLHSMHHEQKKEFGGFWNFALMNLIMVLLVFLVGIGVLYAAMGIQKMGWNDQAVRNGLLLILAISYPLINIVQSVFFHTKGIIKPVTLGHALVWKNLILMALFYLVFGVVALLLLFFGWVLFLINPHVSQGSLELNIYIGVAVIIFYSWSLFSRAFLFGIAKRGT